ncbi:MAG: hypothetical protein HY077_17335 [Elusimicrobia bacterium]|nr:hypothetical protein [Elusimicrobiota bacterium]
MLPLAAWIVRNLIVAATPIAYFSNWNIRSPGSASLTRVLHGVVPWAALFGDVLTTANRAGPRTAAVIGLSCAAIALLGGAILLRGHKASRQARIVLTYMVGMLAMHLCWKTLDIRYMVPFIPLSWALIAAGLRPWLKDRRVLTCGLTAAAGWICLTADWTMLRSRAGAPSTLWPATMSWIRDNTPPSARVLSMFDATLALLADRTAFEFPLDSSLETREQWLQYCRQNDIQYFHWHENLGWWSNLPDDRRRMLESIGLWTRSGPGVTEVFREPREQNVVFRLDPPDRP